MIGLSGKMSLDLKWGDYRLEPRISLWMVKFSAKTEKSTEWNKQIQAGVKIVFNFCRNCWQSERGTEKKHKSECKTLTHKKLRWNKYNGERRVWNIKKVAETRGPLMRKKKDREKGKCYDKK